jgi:hypothetical protein
MSRFLNSALLSAALVIMPAVARAENKPPQSYHDKEHNDDHQWNDHEDRAYRMWVKDQHRKYNDFHKLNERDQSSYWGWRHDHSDSLLKIDIH